MQTCLFRASCALVVATGFLLAANSAFGLQQRQSGAEFDTEHEALIANPYATTGNCGVERWSVKTGTDADADLVDLGNPVSQTISYLRSLTAPATPPANNRVQPAEITNFVLDATLVEYKLENDSDYHLVIEDGQGNTMIAEIPDPACVGAGSPMADGIANSRQQFDSAYTATSSFKTANIPVQLTGVAMFDFLHGQTGVAPNGIELHPVVGIVFNPGSGGTADFALSASPASLSVSQGSSVTTTISVLPSNGFSNSVSFTASGLPAGVSASFSPTSSPASSALTLTAASNAAVGSATVTINGTSGSLAHATTLTLTVNMSGGGGGGAQTASYNSAFKAPACTSVGVSCDSGTLLVGRGTMSGGVEPNQPNTIGSTCADGNSGTFHSDESNDRIVIASTDGGPLTAGKMARITATMWAYSTANALDLYSAADASNPNWTFLNSISAAAAGEQTLSTTFVLPAGGVQAVRAHLRYNGSAATCSTSAYDESDDLVFAVAAAAPAADFSLSASPGSVTVAQGSSGSSTISVTPQNGFSGNVALSAAGLPSGVTATFSPSSTSGTSTLTVNASSAAATGAVTISITGSSGSLSHSTTLSLTVNPTALPDFSLSASPGNLSIAQGSSGSSTISVTPQNGFSSNVALSASGLPTGVTAAFSPSSTSTTSSVTFSAGSTAIAGTTAVTVTGTSGSLSHATSLNLTVTVPSGGGGSLQNGVALTGQAAATGGQLTYTVVIPAGASNLVIATSGGSGDADLYVKFGSAPTLSSYDCRPYISGNNESCTVASPQAGTYYVMLNGYQAFSGVSIQAAWSTGGGGGGGGDTMHNDVPITGLSATKNNFTTAYTLTVPAGQSVATFTISGNSGDADLYVRRGSAPTTSSYDCRPYLTGDNETCTFNSPTAGTYYVSVRAYATFSGVTLTGSYSP